MHSLLEKKFMASAEFENCVDQLYLLYAKCYKKDSQFWLDLCVEEKIHASFFCFLLSDLIVYKNVINIITLSDLNVIQETMAYLNSLIYSFKLCPFSINSAYSIALDIEALAVEHTYQQVMTVDSHVPEHLLMQRINKDSVDHHARISLLIKTSFL